MAQLRRDGPYMWVTWLTRLLVGESSCVQSLPSLLPPLSPSTTSTIGYSFTILLSAHHN